MTALVIDDSLLTECMKAAEDAEANGLCHKGMCDELCHGISRTGVLSTMDARLVNLMIFAIMKAADRGLCDKTLESRFMHDVIDRNQTTATLADGRRVVRGAPAQDGMKVGGLTYNELRSELRKREDNEDGD